MRIIGLLPIGFITMQRFVHEQGIERGLRLVACDSRLQTADNYQPPIVRIGAEGPQLSKVRCLTKRNPQVNRLTGSKPGEARFCNADDGEDGIVETNGFPYSCRRSAEGPLPVRIIKHSHGSGAGSFIVGQKSPANRWRYS